MKIPFHKPYITQAETNLVVKTMQSGWLATGKVALNFEYEFGDKVGARHTLATSSGTLASLLLMQAFGIGAGDEVIFPAWTFSGPAMMAHHLGAKVVICDVDPDTMNMDPNMLMQCITSRTKMIIPTHFAGVPCDIIAFNKIARQANAYLVDDAAHAFPSQYRSGQLVGCDHASDATFFSFYATKTITCGEGGMITTADAGIADKVKRLRSHGMNIEGFNRYQMQDKPTWFYDVTEAGWGASLSDLHAAVGLVQLRRHETLNSRRAFVAGLYDQAFRTVLDLKTPAFNAGNSWHLYPIRLDLDQDTTEIFDLKTRFIELMLDQGVACSVHFIPLPHHAFWRKNAKSSEIPIADYLSRRVLSLPIYPSMNTAECNHVIQAVMTCMELLRAERK